MTRILLIAPISLALVSCNADNASHSDMADHDGMVDHSEHMAAMQDAELTPSQKAYAEVNDRMHAGMADIPEDADEAFMRGMLAHHRGAVEMSQVALEYGEDAQVRDLAQRIIDAQEAEIQEMEEWLAARSE